jgi:hypothetical protein
LPQRRVQSKKDLLFPLILIFLSHIFFCHGNPLPCSSFEINTAIRCLQLAVRLCFRKEPQAGY